MSGRSAAYKVAIKNAKRNRKRTIFLVLLVAVPVAFGVVVAGIVRASTLTPQERAQSYFGAADARLQVYSPTGDIYTWITENLQEIAPSVEITELRQTGIRVADVGYGQVWDLDMTAAATDGFLVQVSGDLPQSDEEVALSPTLAEKLEVGVGDTVDFEELPFGELTVVGFVSQPFFNQSTDILLRPGALEPLVGDPKLLPEPSLLVSGDGAEEAVLHLNDRWYGGGQELFWPDPMVGSFPEELAFLVEGDPVLTLLLTEADVGELMEILEGADPDEDVIGEVYNAANQMIYGTGEYRGLPDVYVETRTQWLSQGGFENPFVVSTAASAIVLVEVAFITGAAFAAGTRRRLREIGLMGANGASQKHVRMTVVGEGLSIGAVGAGLGVVLGVLVMVLARPILHRFVSRVITGLGVAFTDVLGPVLVALISVVLAVLIPARTASKVPTTTALQGRMPALSPRKWVVPVGIGLAVLGGLLTSVSIVSTSGFASVLVGVGAVAVVGGVAMLSSPILAGLSKLSDRVPATSRLVLRDSGRNRTRAAVAVAAIMVILLAPITAMVTSATTAEKNLVYGLPSPSEHLLLTGSYEGVNFGNATPFTDSDVAAVAAVVPEKAIAVFDTLDLRVLTADTLEAREAQGEGPIAFQFSDGYPVAVANDQLVAALDDPGVSTAVANDEIVILGIAEKTTRVEIDGVERSAQEFPVPVVQWSMPRVLVPESMVSEFGEVDTRPVALFVLERTMTDSERQEMWTSLNLQIDGGYGSLDAATIYLLMGAATLVVVLIVVALVTAVSAAEVDQELRTIVAVGAPGAIRRRFLGLLTGYQTLVAMLLAVPLGLGLVWVFSSAQDYIQAGPFGTVDGSTIAIPWAWIIPFALLLPIVIGLLTLTSVRSAPVTPPRRAT